MQDIFTSYSISDPAVGGDGHSMVDVTINGQLMSAIFQELLTNDTANQKAADMLAGNIPVMPKQDLMNLYYPVQKLV